MGLFAHARPLVAALAVTGALAGLAACDAGGDGTALPSSLPSIERTLGRETTVPARTTEPAGEATTTRGNDEPTTTAATRPTTDPTTDPTTTAATTPPTTRATTPSPTKPPTTPPTTRETTPPTTEATTTTPHTTTASASPAPAASTSSGLSTGGWLLILALVALAILVAVLLVNRSRRTAAWQTEAVNLASAGRNLIATRLPAVLSAREAADRALAWPPVRGDLTEMSARWAALAGRATDDYHRDSAGQISVMFQDLVSAVDAENQALATGRDWRVLSPQVDEIVRALDTALTVFAAPQPDPNAGGAGPAPYPA